MSEHFHILDAFVDGEAVDPDALRQALADEAGRDYLIDAWLLRDLVQEEIAGDELTATERVAPPKRRWLAAAAVAGVSLLGGYLAGARFPGPIAPDPAVPAPAVVAPALGVSPTPVTPDPLVRGVAAPPATRVIRLELDPNWKETAGAR